MRGDDALVRGTSCDLNVLYFSFRAPSSGRWKRSGYFNSAELRSQIGRRRYSPSWFCNFTLPGARAMYQLLNVLWKFYDVKYIRAPIYAIAFLVRDVVNPSSPVKFLWLRGVLFLTGQAGWLMKIRRVISQSWQISDRTPYK